MFAHKPQSKLEESTPVARDESLGSANNRSVSLELLYAVDFRFAYNYSNQSTLWPSEGCSISPLWSSLTRLRVAQR